jgi:hypothetical protein
MDLLLKSTAVPDRYLQAQGALPYFNLGFSGTLFRAIFVSSRSFLEFGGENGESERAEQDERAMLKVHHFGPS